MQINLLGNLQVLIDHHPVDALRGQRVRSIFVYLLLHAGTAVARSELAGTLWPEIPESQARTNLRRELHALKNTHAAINACITASKHTVTWHMPTNYTFDVEQFNQLCQAFNVEQDSARKSSLGLEAVALYRDPLLPGIADEWLASKREALHQQWNLLSENLIGVLQDFDVSEQIITIATRQLTFDPYLETAYLAIMEAYIASGNAAMALHTYHQCASILKKDLDIAPNEPIQNLHAQLLSKSRVQGEYSAGGKLALKENSSLIGRSEALAEVTEFITMTAGDSPRAAIIIGESGIGKSSLAEAVLNSADLNYLLKVRSECHPARIETAFGPFRDWLSNQQFWNACKQLAEFNNSTLQRIFPQLKSNLREIGNKKNRPLRSQEEIFTALSNVICTVSEFYSAGQRAKLLLYIDDLQWADTDFFNWLKYFLANEKQSNVMFLATVRTEEMDSVNPVSGLINDFSYSNQISVKTLPHLSQTEACELIKNQLARYPEHKAAQLDSGQIYHWVQGNPLFLIEAVNHMLHAGSTQKPGQQNGSGAKSKIYNMLQRRINLLAANSRQLLLFASVVQRQFSLPLIQALTRFTDGTLMDTLDDLWESGMLREVNRGEYDFAHDSLREACYTMLTSPKKRIMHIQVAKALEKLNPEQTETLAGEIATHYEKTGDVETALDWLEHAIEHARKTLAANRCIEYSERGLQRLDTTSSIVSRADRQVRLLAGLAVGHSLKEGFGSKALSPICQEMEELLPYVHVPEIRWRVIYIIRLAATFSYQTYSALRLTELQLSTAKNTHSVINIIEAYKARAFVLYQLGRFTEALGYLDAGLKVALTAESQNKLDRLRPPWSLAMLSKIRIQVLYLIGRFKDAGHENEIGHSYEHCVGDPRSRAFVYMWEAENNLIRNRPAFVEQTGKIMVKIGQEEQVAQVEYLGRFFVIGPSGKKVTQKRQ